MILGELGLDIGPAVAGLGVVGHRRRLRGPEPRPRLPQRGPDPIENQFGKGDVVRDRRGRRARSRTSACGGRRCATSTASSTPCRTARSGRLEPDPGLGADQPGRHGRLRHRHRPGDRGRRRRRPRDGRRPGLEAAGPRGAARRAGRGARRVRRHAQDPAAPSGRPTSGRPPASCRKRLLAAFQANGIEIAAAAARRPGARPRRRRGPAADAEAGAEDDLPPRRRPSGAGAGAAVTAAPAAVG